MLKCVLGKMNTDCQMETSDGQILFISPNRCPLNKWMWAVLKPNGKRYELLYGLYK